MRSCAVLVIFMVLFISCGSGPGAVDSSDVSSHAIPARRGTTPAQQGTPIETKSKVFFSDGSLDEYTVSVYDTAKNTQLNLQERYSASGQLVETIEYTYNEDNDFLTTKMTKSDDNKLKSRVVYQYDDNNNLTNEIFVGRNGKTVSSYDYTYDKDGNMLTRIIRGPSPANTALSETVYSYQNGLVVSSETKDSKLGRLISKAQNQYDSDGNLINQIISNSSGNITRRVTSEWRNGLEVKNEQLDARGDVLLRITNEYGSAGELLKKTIENIEGNSTQVLEYEYAFQQARSTRR